MGVGCAVQPIGVGCAVQPIGVGCAVQPIGVGCAVQPSLIMLPFLARFTSRRHSFCIEPGNSRPGLGLGLSLSLS